MKQPLQNLKKAWLRAYRPSAFRQWITGKEMQAKMAEEYLAMFDDRPVLCFGTEVQIGKSHVTGTVRNVQKQSDGSLYASVMIDENNAQDESYESRYTPGRVYHFDVDNLVKVSDPEPVESSDTYEKTFQLREYAQREGIKLDF